VNVSALAFVHRSSVQNRTSEELNNFWWWSDPRYGFWITFL